MDTFKIEKVQIIFPLPITSSVQMSEYGANKMFNIRLSY